MYDYKNKIDKKKCNEKVENNKYIFYTATSSFPRTALSAKLPRSRCTGSAEDILCTLSSSPQTHCHPNFARSLCTSCTTCIDELLLLSNSAIAFHRSWPWTCTGCRRRRNSCNWRTARSPALLWSVGTVPWAVVPLST